MFAGHFGLAAGIRAKAPEVPLWALMLGTQLLDVVFLPLYLTNVETIDNPFGTGYGKGVIHADYTHSLLGALIISLLAGLIARWLWGKQAGWILGGVVFSHWMLDLVVHRTDMPLLPDNWGSFPLLGLGVWRFDSLSIAIELLILIIGFWMYARSAIQRGNGTRKKAAIVSSIVLGCLLGFALITDVTSLF
ncbi:permease [Paenibacillus alba]|uniref:metal-dependent hydrolase n=1 Tax=Paenibacillus alba TaxID=1197127 RepID=UPI001567B74D|nr:metal-dependent hydrolase [Paenibacillus alba]NQX71627.1 permease [Paenibacillus alba]